MFAVLSERTNIYRSTTMPHQQATLPLLRGTPTLESAIEQEEDMLLERRIEFFVSLYSNRGDIEDIVSYHLGLGRSETCRLGDINEWLHGSFKVCIPIYTHRQSQQPEKRALIRFPLPYKLGESKYPGNVDEKLRCEAATYIWIKEHCPETPTPQIWGFGACWWPKCMRFQLISTIIFSKTISNTMQFTKPENTPLTTRIPWYFKRYISWLLESTPSCNYVCHRHLTMLESGYLLMDYVGNSEVQMLSETWEEDHHH